MSSDPDDYADCETFRDVILQWAEAHPSLDPEHVAERVDERVPDLVLALDANEWTVPGFLEGLEQATEEGEISHLFVDDYRMN